MPDFRCHCELDAILGDRIILNPEESNHLVAANRARVGDPVRVFDGGGNEWDTTLEEAHKRKAVLKILSTHQIQRPPYSIALAQAIPKGKLIDSIIKRATEIGATDLYPISTARTESKVEGKKESAKNAKWHAATLEGAKQSGNPFLIEIHPIQGFVQLLANSSDYELKLIASLTPNATSLRTHIKNYESCAENRSPKKILWLVGPEGDFTPEETEAAITSGFLPTTLGPHVMRCETAAIHAISITQYELTER